MTRRTLWIPSLALAIALLAACGAPDPGSQEGLEAAVDEIDLPAGMVELGRKFTADCPGTCPLIVVWYRVTSLAEVESALVDSVTEAGWDVNEASASPQLYAASTEDHMMFVVLDQEMIARNPIAPAGTNAEISVHLLDDPAG